MEPWQKMLEDFAVAMMKSHDWVVSPSLYDFVADVARQTKELGGQLRSRQVVALAISTWGLNNPYAATCVPKNR